MRLGQTRRMGPTLGGGTGQNIEPTTAWDGQDNFNEAPPSLCRYALPTLPR